MLNINQRIALIDSAIDDILLSLSNGIEIKSYQIDGISVVKDNPIELISQLKSLRNSLVLAKSIKRIKRVRYVF